VRFFFFLPRPGLGSGLSLSHHSHWHDSERCQCAIEGSFTPPVIGLVLHVSAVAPASLSNHQMPVGWYAAANLRKLDTFAILTS
jgi:hypothetical protein